MLRKLTVFLICLFGSGYAHAQLLKKLKERVVSETKSAANDKKEEARSAIQGSVRGEMNRLLSEFDSTSLDYAVLVSDNAGLLAQHSGRELGGKFIRLVTISNALLKQRSMTDEENAGINLDMGQVGYATGRYLFAEKRLAAARNLFERAGIKDDPRYLKTLSSQGLLFTTMGRFTLAAQFTEEALQARRQRYGNTDMHVAASLNNTAVLQYNTGHYNEAEKIFNEALGLVALNHEEESLAAALIRNNEAILFQSIGRYDAAVKFLQRSMEIIRKLESSTAAGYLKIWSNLALLYQQMGKYEEADAVYKELDGKLDDKSDKAALLDNRAILMMLMNRPDQIMDYLQQSKALFSSATGEQSLATAKVKSDIGNYYRFQGKLGDAEPLLKDVLDVRSAALGAEHPLFVQSLEDMAILRWKQRNLKEAAALYKTVMDQTVGFINRYFGPMSDNEKSRYWDILSPRFERYYNFVADAGPANPSLIKDLLEYRMAVKGLLLNSTRTISQAIAKSGDDQLQGDYSAWTDLKQMLSRLYTYSKEELQEQQIDADSIEQAANTLEKSLSERSKDFAQFLFASHTGIDDIKQALQPGEALVELIRFRRFGEVLGPEGRYAALVFGNGDAQPKMILLDKGADMEDAWARAYRISMKNRLNDEQSWLRYWAPVETALAGRKKVFVSPDGIYSQINLNTLKRPGGGPLIDQFEFRLIGNPRDILHRDNDVAGSTRKATLLGAPVFSSEKIPALPATKTEVDGISGQLQKTGYAVKTFTGKDANESNLLAASRTTILHIATHGYFLKDVDHPNFPLGVSADHARDNVLFRSGILLTGASESSETNAELGNDNNGVVTSYEAMNLDLQGTSLVVLSACETGLGEIRAGEGVYGLQRAFLAAGADAVIMSLWKVDDAATQQLMLNFYSNWAKEPDKQKAFRLAQQQLMAKYKDPYFWGAFVLMQD